MCYHSKSAGKVRWCTFAWILQEWWDFSGRGENSAQALVSWEQGEELPWIAVVEAAFSRRAALGHWLFPGARSCPGVPRIWGRFCSNLVLQVGLPGLQMSIGSLAGQAGIRCSMQSPPIAAPGPVHALHGPGTQSCPGAGFQSQITP